MNRKHYSRFLHSGVIGFIIFFIMTGGIIHAATVPDGVVLVDKTINPADAPVYMGNVLTGGNQMELSVDFPDYDKPVDIWLLILLPDGRHYVANESGKLISLKSGNFVPIATGVSNTRTTKKILSPFEVGAVGTRFDPWPEDGTWMVYWLIAPESNGDIIKAIENGDYELGFYSFPVYSQDKKQNSTVIVDDYSGTSVSSDRQWYYSCIGTDRGKMGDGNYSVATGNGKATVQVTSGWAGIWTSLKYNSSNQESLDPSKILGSYVAEHYQPQISGVALRLIEGYGKLKVELKDAANNMIAYKIFSLTGGASTVSFDVSTTKSVKFLNWLIDGVGNATVDEVYIKLTAPLYTTSGMAFLYSYGHLSQCYDHATGLTRDRANWPVTSFSSVQTIGTFALTTAVAWKQGFVTEATARAIILKTRDTILALPRYHGLLPHFITNGVIANNTEWSTVDTVIALVAEILACQALGEDTSELEAMIRAIDWADLSDNGTRSISHGYNYKGEKLTSGWDTFGSEAFLVAVAYASATGKSNILLERSNTPPTWDGSGFNDELAALFFPMDQTDLLGNDWQIYRAAAFEKQKTFISNPLYAQYKLFGASAAEVPEPWVVAEDKIYSAWGVGGHNLKPNDGSSLVGYPIIAPHYVAMVSSEHTSEFENIFGYLIKNNMFTPLNNVESFGIDNDGNIHLNFLKGSWNLSLQTLGAGHALQGDDYLPYKSLNDNAFLKKGYSLIMP